METLAEVAVGADVLVGLSVGGMFTQEMVKSMAADPIVFAMATPDPEIRPESIEGLAAVVATGLGVLDRSVRMTADYMARYQRLKVRDPDLPPDHPDAGGSPRDLWASSIRLGAFYEFPVERNDASH